MRQPRWLICWIVALMAVPAFGMTQFKLKNGLEVVLIHDPSSALVSARTYVKAGSIYEDPLLGSGLSHYLEHLVAGGSTEKNPESYYQKQIAKMGGAFNAYTTFDHTAYYIDTTPEYARDAVQMLYEWMFFSKFDPKEVARERNVIEREMEKSDANIPRQLFRAAQENFYKHHPLRLPVIGFLSDFQAVTTEQLKAYYQTRYVPANMILVVGGQFDEDVLKADIQTAWEKIPASASPELPRFVEPNPFSPRTVEQPAVTEVTYVSLRYPTVDLYSSDLYALDLLEFMLGEGERSILHTEIVENKKLAYGVSCSSFTPTMTTGFFEVSMEVDYENVNQAVREVEKLIKKVQKGKIESSRIDRARKQKLSEDMLGIETIQDKVSRVGQSMVFAHYPNFFDDYYGRFNTVNAKDVQRVAIQYLKTDRMIKTILKPKNEQMGKKQTHQKDGMALSATPTLKTLDNGLRVLMMKDPSLPKTIVNTFVLGGLREETDRNNGIGQLTASLLGKGSKKYSKAQILDLVESKGAVLSGYIGNHTLYYSLHCLSDDLAALVPVYFESFLQASFPDDELAEARRRQLKQIDNRQESWFDYALYQVKKDFFGAHPYSLARLGEKASIKRLTSDDIRTYFKGLLNPESMLITVFGDYDEKKILGQIKKQFSDLKPGVGGAKKDLSRRPHTRQTERALSVPQDVSAVLIAFDGLSVKDKDQELKVDLVDSVLSGMSYPGGRLHTELREKGLVYMVHATHFQGIESGYFLIYALTNKDHVEEVKKVIFHHINDIKKQVISDDEFDQALAQVRYALLEQASSLSSLSMLAATDELYGKGFDHYKTQMDEIKSLNKEDVQTTATSFLTHPQVYIFNP